MRRSHGFGFLCRGATVLVVALVGITPGTVTGQTPIDLRNFAPRNIGVAIARSNLRNISMLPPMTNPVYSWEFDPTLEVYAKQRDDIGSGMVVAPHFTRKGGVSVAVAFAYYRLDELGGEDSSSIVASVPSDRFNPDSRPINLGLATKVHTDVYVTRFTGRYTILDKLDVGIEVPLVAVDVDSQFLVQLLEPGEFGNFLRRGVDRRSVGNETLIDAKLNQIDLPDGFNEGTNFDFGNVVLDAKMGFETGVPGLDLGVQGGFRLPTANEERFTGFESTSFRGVLLASYRVKRFGFYLNGGYEQDFETNILSNGIVGASVTFSPITPLLLEFGMRGNFYVKDIDLYESERFGIVLPGSRVVAGSSDLGTNEVNLAGGVRYNPVGDLSLSVYVSGPVTSDGYRSDTAVFMSADYSL
jgi:hypothetical protein